MKRIGKMMHVMFMLAGVLLCMTACGGKNKDATSKDGGGAESAAPSKEETNVSPEAPKDADADVTVPAGNVADNGKDNVGDNAGDNGNKVLVAYFSATGTTKKLAEYAAQVMDADLYEIVFIAYPIWWGNAPHIMDTFMESYDFSGKTIVPFCTSGSSGIGSSAENLHAYTDGSVTWLDGARLKGNLSKEDMADWIRGLSLGIEVK